MRLFSSLNPLLGWISTPGLLLLLAEQSYSWLMREKKKWIWIMRRRQLYSTAWCLAGEKSLRGFKKWHNLEITLSFLSFWPPWIISHLSLAVEGSRLCSELWNMWEENLGTSCTPHTTEILDSFPSTLTHVLGFKEKMCASEKNVTNFVLLHKACVTLSNFSKKNKQNLTYTIDCQNS